MFAFYIIILSPCRSIKNIFPFNGIYSKVKILLTHCPLEVLVAASKSLDQETQTLGLNCACYQTWSFLRNFITQRSKARRLTGVDMLSQSLFTI